MREYPKPTVQLPGAFQCTSEAKLPPAGIPSPAEMRDVVTGAIEHLGPRLTSTRFTISPTIAVGTTRFVLTVSAVDSNEAFAVKVTTKDLIAHPSIAQINVPPTFRNEWVTRHLAMEQEIPYSGQRHVTVAPLVKGDTLFAHATQRGLSEREWDIGYETVPTVMRAIWREARCPHDPNLGTLLDHHLDNIIVGVIQPPFQAPSGDETPRFVFVDRRDDGLYHTETTLNEAIEDFRTIFKRHALVRSAWG